MIKELITWAYDRYVRKDIPVTVWMDTEKGLEFWSDDEDEAHQAYLERHILNQHGIRTDH